jgi:excisionase family DNA binding protein
MSRTTAEIFSDLTPTGPQPLPQGGLYIQAPFHPTDHLTVYLTTEDVGELLHMNVENVRKLISSGQIRASFIGRRWLCTRANVEAFLQSKAEGGPKGK